MKVLFYAYGNPGRQDDGLAHALAEKLEGERWSGITFENNYQLNIEDAALVAEHDLVIFADASVNSAEPFEFRPIEPAKAIAFTTHAMSPQSVLALCDDIYHKLPPAYLLAIRGYEWEQEQPLSSMAKQNLQDAFEFIRDFLLRLFKE